jgi:mannitol-1-phosphate/altronate dehydrogenase
LGSVCRWYTDRAPDAASWGITAFTGRRTELADALAPQDGLYTLVTLDRDGDNFAVLGSVSAVHPSSGHEAWLAYVRDPEVAIVTTTVTEAGPDGDRGRRRPRPAGRRRAHRALRHHHGRPHHPAHQGCDGIALPAW